MHASAPSDIDLASLVSARGGKRSMDVHCPFDDSVIGSLPVSTRDDVAAAFATARSAQADWARTPMQDRTRVLTRFRDLVLDHNTELLTWIH